MQVFRQPAKGRIIEVSNKNGLIQVKFGEISTHNLEPTLCITVMCTTLCILVFMCMKVVHSVGFGCAYPIASKNCEQVQQTHVHVYP